MAKPPVKQNIIKQINDNFYDNVQEILSVFGIKTGTKEEQLCNLVIKSAYEDLKLDKKNKDQPKNFQANSHPKTKSLEENLSKYIQKTYNLEEDAAEKAATDIAEKLKTGINGTGIYDELKSQLDYTRVMGVGKSFPEKIQSLVGIVYRAMQTVGAVISYFSGYKPTKEQQVAQNTEKSKKPEAHMHQTRGNLKTELDKISKSLSKHKVEENKQENKGEPRKPNTKANKNNFKNFL